MAGQIDGCGREVRGGGRGIRWSGGGRLWGHRRLLCESVPLGQSWARWMDGQLDGCGREMRGGGLGSRRWVCVWGGGGGYVDTGAVMCVCASWIELGRMDGCGSEVWGGGLESRRCGEGGRVSGGGGEATGTAEDVM